METEEAKDDRSLAIERAFKFEGALVAEQKLEAIAHAEGDEAVAKIARNLKPSSITEIVREGDVVKPSLLHGTITPEQFITTFRTIGIRWGAAAQDDCSSYTLHCFQEELKQSFAAFFLATDDKSRREALVRALLNEDNGTEAIAFSVIHETKELEDFINGEPSSEDDWREGLAFIRDTFKEEWFGILRYITEARGNRYRTFVHRVAAEMYAIALVESGQEPQGKVEEKENDDLFKPLP